VLQLRVRGRINITEAEMRAEYTRLVGELQRTLRPHAWHIFFAVPEDASPAQVEAVTTQARAAMARVRAGESFDAVARELSQDAASREAGGDLGEVDADALPEVITRALGEIPLNTASEPVRGPSGVHVLRVTERRPPPAPSFESVRERIQGVMMNREMFRQREVYVRELRRAVSVEDRLEARGESAEPAPEPAAAPAAR